VVEVILITDIYVPKGWESVKELGLEITEKILFSDSQCVLYWLKTNKPLSLFIENRVKEIITEKDIIFQYIESAQNPADIATRGSSVSGISQSDLWWSGPAWLKNEDSLWPLGLTSHLMKLIGKQRFNIYLKLL